jgi:hypothetical protein
MEQTNWMLIFLFLGICVAMMMAGMLRKGSILEYPFLAAAIFFSFVLPQLPGLAIDPYLPEFAFKKTMMVTISCAAMIWIGWLVGRRPMKIFAWEMNEKRLIAAAAILSLFGAFFFFKLSRLPEEVKGASLYTGLPVAYLFFAQLLSYGFAIAMILFARNRSYPALAIVVFGGLFYADRIIFAGRRAVLSEFIVIILLSLWFGRRKAVPWVLGLVGVIVGTLVLASTGDYRRVAKAEKGPSLAEVKQIDFVGNLNSLMANGGAEMRNAIYKINAIDENMILDFGANHWNVVVFNYIPAQIVGREIKESFIINVKDPYKYVDHMPMVGSTDTGMSDAFGSFWYLGAIKFFIIALVMKHYYKSAMRGNIPAQLFYMLLLTPSLLTITHHTQTIVSYWIHMMIFLVPFLIWARKTVNRGVRSFHPHSLLAERECWHGSVKSDSLR